MPAGSSSDRLSPLLSRSLNRARVRASSLPSGVAIATGTLSESSRGIVASPRRSRRRGRREGFAAQPHAQLGEELTILVLVGVRRSQQAFSQKN